MFIRPNEKELKEFKPNFLILCASKAKIPNYKELNMNSETGIVFNLTEKV